MKNRKVKRAVALVSVFLVIAVCAGYWLVFAPFAPDRGGEEYLYVRENGGEATAEAVYSDLERMGYPGKTLFIRMLGRVSGYTRHVKAGRYRVSPDVSALRLFRDLRNGHQEPVKFTVPYVRTVNDLAARLAEQFSCDSATWAERFADAEFCSRYGVTPATLPCLFVANTYEVFWDVTPDNLMKRMQRESATFWTEARRQAAREAGLSECEVMTLASIVDQETANDAEKPMIAGMYLNRLRQGMKLQADPTVKFALKNFGLQRIMHEHLTVDSPYNTYKYEGLPPGPIVIPSLAGINAVLNHARHDYLYMCAKEDFSGTHNFAVTYSEHLENARRYAQALDKRNIH